MDCCRSRIEQVGIYSNYLQKQMELAVYLPENYDTGDAFPVLYFLHGRSGDERIMLELGIREVADSLLQKHKIMPLLIVCPRMENSRGLNSSLTARREGGINLGRYEDYFVKEIISFVDKHYKTDVCREKRFVGGISAGGYAALRYGLQYPGLFARVGGHMPALERQLDPEDIPYFGTEGAWVSLNPMTIAEDCSLLPDMKFYLDAGSHDEGRFYEGCAELCALLERRGVNVQNHVFPGHHNADYIRSNLEKYLIFYAGL